MTLQCLLDTICAKKESSAMAVSSTTCQLCTLWPKKFRSSLPSSDTTTVENTVQNGGSASKLTTSTPLLESGKYVVSGVTIAGHQPTATSTKESTKLRTA